MKVSVIMPVYNEEKYIAGAIQSWINQSLEEKELICIDDGSTDGTTEIIEQYRQKNANIVLLKQNRQGAGAARNLGLQHMTGEFVCFLDADDFFVDKDSLNTLYKAAIENNANVSAGLLQIYRNNDVIYDSVLRNLLDNKRFAIIKYKDFQFDYQYQCYLFKSSFLKENNLQFPLFKRFQDPPFLVQALHKSTEFVLNSVEFYGYRYGEKKIEYTLEKTNDLFDGLLFDLKYAYDNGLEKLFYLTLKRMNEDYFQVLFEGIRDKNIYLLKALIEANELAQKKGSTIFVLDSLFYVREKFEGSIARDIRIEQKLEKILMHKKQVVVYGAGKVGKLCHSFIKKNKKYKMSGWIDKFKAGTEVNGELLLSISSLEKIDYDCILIAIENEELSNQIKQDLIECGVMKDRIVEWII